MRIAKTKHAHAKPPKRLRTLPVIGWFEIDDIIDLKVSSLIGGQLSSGSGELQAALPHHSSQLLLAFGAD
jgi:hypothetical protein